MKNITMFNIKASLNKVSNLFLVENPKTQVIINFKTGDSIKERLEFEETLKSLPVSITEKSIIGDSIYDAAYIITLK